jgi:signal transduction histidine kinase
MTANRLQLLWLDDDEARLAVASAWLQVHAPQWQLRAVTGAVALASVVQSTVQAAIVAWPCRWLQVSDLSGLNRVLGHVPLWVLHAGADPGRAETLQLLQQLAPLQARRHLPADFAALPALVPWLQELAQQAPIGRTEQPPQLPLPQPRQPTVPVASNVRTTGPLGRRLSVVAPEPPSLADRTAAVAHDLQEPLRSVASYLQVLQRQHGDQLPEDGKELVDKAKAAAQRMAARVRTLVDRPEETATCDADAVLQQVVADLTSLLTERGLQVQYATLGTLPLPADTLARVLQNLLSNAARHGCRNGGVVRVTAQRTPETITLRVADDGPGVPLADRDGLFAWRVRGGGADSVGSGIGLAGTAQLLQQHGGRIWLDAEAPVGATFCVQLPVVGVHSVAVGALLAAP